MPENQPLIQESSGCEFCIDAGLDFDWCRICGRGKAPEPPVEPMTGLRLAVRIAKGGPLSDDGPAEREAYKLGVQERRRELLREHGQRLHVNDFEPLCPACLRFG